MRKHIRAAMEAHTNLTVFASIVEILEGGTVCGGDNKAARQIIAICKKEQVRQLRAMDAAIAKATQGQP